MPEIRPSTGLTASLRAAVFALAACSNAAAQGLGTVNGLVVDTSGAAVPSAAVSLQRAQVDDRQITTGPDGRFAFRDVPIGEYVLRVMANGFAEERKKITVMTENPAPLTIALHPAGFTDTVTVTASRGAARLESPASATVLTAAELMNSAPVTIDEALRNTPGFSLFRRSSSRTSTPPTQGVTLRGIAGSGASRTLVLADGTPLNDPFGSWVYWNRIPLVAIERRRTHAAAHDRMAARDPRRRPALPAVAQGAFTTSVSGKQHGSFTGFLTMNSVRV